MDPILPLTTQSLTRSRIDFASRERFLSLRDDLAVEAFGLNQLTLQPGQRGRIHRHRLQEEVYLVLGGTLTLIVESQRHQLRAGEIARLPGELRRQLVNQHRLLCVVLAIGGAGKHVGRDGEAFNGWIEREGQPPQEIPLPDDLPRSLLR